MTRIIFYIMLPWYIMKGILEFFLLLWKAKGDLDTAARIVDREMIEVKQQLFRERMQHGIVDREKIQHDEDLRQ